MSAGRYLACLLLALMAAYALDHHFFGAALYSALVCVLLAVDGVANALKAKP